LKKAHNEARMAAINRAKENARETAAQMSIKLGRGFEKIIF